MLSLAPNMQGIQLVNMSNFIEHYEEHVDRNPEASIFTFVKEHYFNQLTAFEKEHSHLPLKSTISTGFIVFACEFSKVEIIQINDFAISHKKEKFTAFEEAYFFKNYHFIWHPPKSC